jgi:hypothetical protein
VYQPFKAAEVKERAEVCEVSDGAAHGRTGRDRDKDLRPATGFRLRSALRQDQPIAIRVQFDDAEIEALTDVLKHGRLPSQFVRLNREIGQLAGGNETAQRAPLGKQAATVISYNRQRQTGVSGAEASKFGPVGRAAGWWIERWRWKAGIGDLRVVNGLMKYVRPEILV